VSQYNRNKPLHAQLNEVQTDIAAIWSELDQLRRIRFPQADLHRDIRWAMTVGTPVSWPSTGGTYPNTDANTFPIRFLDAHFVKTAGNRTFSYFNRSADPVTIAHAATGQYIPPALPLPVFWQRGLGAEGAGEWWFLDPPRLYVVQLRSVLNAGSSALAEIWLPDAGLTLHASGIVISVKDVGLGAGESRPIGTRLLAHWYLTPYPHWIVYPPPVGLAIATLTYDLCGNTATITGFQRLDGTATVNPPTTARNVDFQHRGLAGDKVLLTYSAIHAAWLVINVTGHDYDVIVGLQRTIQSCDEFGCVTADVIRARLEVCSTHIRRIVFCLPPCPDQTSVQTSEVQTSAEQTSVAVQTSSAGCGGGIVNPELLDEDGGILRIESGLPADRVRLVDITIFHDVTPCNPPSSVGYTTVNPRSNNLKSLFGSFGEVFIHSYSYDSTHPGYRQGTGEFYQLACEQRWDIITGESLATSDEDKEWYVTGNWGTGITPDGSVRVSETQGAAVYRPATNTWEPIPGAVNILSLNPFHARMMFTPPADLFYPSSAQTGGDAQNCGPTEVEWTEV
jgi:hypothetical protein